MVLKAILIGLWSWWVSTPFTLNVGGMFLGRPLFSGLVVGLILGDPIKGMIVGATINLIYLGVISAGGSSPADATVAGIIGTAAAITGGLDAQKALAIAVPIGLLGVTGNTITMTICSIFPAWADAAAEKGDLNRLAFVNLVPRQLVNFPFKFIPAYLVTMYGGDIVKGAINLMPAGLNAGLSVAGKMLPAVGVAMLLMYTGRTKLMPFFFLGFLIAAYFTKDLMFAGLLGMVLGAIYVQFMKSDKEAA
jgi:mannose/fructose/N-acetylgalactosamine-specific phosphotransferase system component IIC